jgi:hypothetical protein
MPLGSAPPLLPRAAAKLLYNSGWVGLDNLFKMLATAQAESNLYPKAWHWNDPASGYDGSTDWGWLQLNDGNKGGAKPKVDINGDAIPDPKVEAFAKMAMTPALAAAQARKLWDTPTGPGRIRGIQPWAAYASGAWKKYMAPSATGIRNFLADKYGFGRI